MSLSMNKELLIRLPSSLYERVKSVCVGEYKSMSAFIRELLLERLNDTLSLQEEADIKKSRKLLQRGRGVSWRETKRG